VISIAGDTTRVLVEQFGAVDAQRLGRRVGQRFDAECPFAQLGEVDCPLIHVGPSIRMVEQTEEGLVVGAVWQPLTLANGVAADEDDRQTKSSCRGLCSNGVAMDVLTTATRCSGCDDAADGLRDGRVRDVSAGAPRCSSARQLGGTP